MRYTLVFCIVFFKVVSQSPIMGFSYFLKLKIILYMPLDEFFSTVSNSEPIHVYTDGACSGNPGPGGWGAIIIQGNKEYELSGSEPNTTNNRMEMMAAIQALEKIPQDYSILLFTDSKYLKDGITLWIHNWKKRDWKTVDKKPVKNQDLWQKLDELCLKHKIIWNWVEGHAGHKENEHADLLARQAIIAQQITNNMAR